MLPCIQSAVGIIVHTTKGTLGRIYTVQGGAEGPSSLTRESNQRAPSCGPGCGPVDVVFVEGARPGAVGLMAFPSAVTAVFHLGGGAGEVFGEVFREIF